MLCPNCKNDNLFVQEIRTVSKKTAPYKIQNFIALRCECEDCHYHSIFRFKFRGDDIRLSDSFITDLTK